MSRRTLIFTAAAATVLLLGLIGLLRYAPGFVNVIDARVASLVSPLQTLDGVELFLAITTVGSAVGVIGIGVGFAYLGRLSLEQVFRLSFALVAVSVAEKIVKELFLRARPSPLLWLDPLPSYSFPSAHAAASMVLYGFIALTLYARVTRTRKARPTARILCFLLPALAILFIGMSRIVLSVHYFSDVIGGYLVGIIVLTLTLWFPLGWLKLSRYE